VVRELSWGLVVGHVAVQEAAGGDMGEFEPLSVSPPLSYEN